MDERFLRRLMARMRCSVCGEHYEMGNVSILGHHDALWFLRVVCTNCQNQGLVAAVIKDGGAREVVTDLTDQDLERFGHASAVTMDDRLDMYNFLRHFDGDFAALFPSG